jgi:ABC-type glycerol-3-phosphate transport system substrate-binding protein
MKALRFLMVTSAALVLAACGGGGGSVEEPVKPQASNKVPTSATASVASYTDYVAMMAGGSTSDQLDVQDVQPPTSEVAMPSKVN